MEVKALKRCTPDLEAALKGLDPNLVHFLREEGFITDHMHEEILNRKSPFSDTNKASELVKWIKNRVEQDSESYHDLLRWLKDAGKFYRPIVKKLEAECAEVSSTSVEDGNGEDKELNNLLGGRLYK